MVSTLYAILWALISIALGYCGGIATAALMMVAKSDKEHKHRKEEKQDGGR